MCAWGLRTKHNARIYLLMCWATPYPFVIKSGIGRDPRTQHRFWCRFLRAIAGKEHGDTSYFRTARYNDEFGEGAPLATVYTTKQPLYLWKTPQRCVQTRIVVNHVRSIRHSLCLVHRASCLAVAKFVVRYTLFDCFPKHLAYCCCCCLSSHRSSLLQVSTRILYIPLIK